MEKRGKNKTSALVPWDKLKNAVGAPSTLRGKKICSIVLYYSAYDDMKRYEVGGQPSVRGKHCNITNLHKCTISHICNGL